MPTDTPSDREIIAAIGREALLAAGLSEHVIKKWRIRGIPWKERSRVAALATQQRVWLPPDFLQERRAA